MQKKYSVKLNDLDRELLEHVVKARNAPARKITRAWILLKSNCSEGAPNWSYGKICQAYNVSEVTVYQVRKSYVETG